jgi:hypothetical protein
LQTIITATSFSWPPGRSPVIIISVSQTDFQFLEADGTGLVVYGTAACAARYCHVAGEQQFNDQDS